MYSVLFIFILIFLIIQMIHSELDLKYKLEHFSNFNLNHSLVLNQLFTTISTANQFKTIKLESSISSNEYRDINQNRSIYRHNRRIDDNGIGKKIDNEINKAVDKEIDKVIDTEIDNEIDNEIDKEVNKEIDNERIYKKGINILRLDKQILDNSSKKIKNLSNNQRPNQNYKTKKFKQISRRSKRTTSVYTNDLSYNEKLTAQDADNELIILPLRLQSELTNHEINQIKLNMKNKNFTFMFDNFNSSNYQNATIYVDFPPSLKVFFYCVYTLIFFVGLIGNSLVSLFFKLN